jgi:hypothetical protein
MFSFSNLHPHRERLEVPPPKQMEGEGMPLAPHGHIGVKGRILFNFVIF